MRAKRTQDKYKAIILLYKTAIKIDIKILRYSRHTVS